RLQSRPVPCDRGLGRETRLWLRSCRRSMHGSTSPLPVPIRSRRRWRRRRGHLPAIHRAESRYQEPKRAMTSWIETYRGAVPPWQCDVTEHFTIAYYFDRLEEADASLADELGLGDLQHRTDTARRISARFVRELRAGASFHVESAALGIEEGLRLGHRFVDS